MEMDHEEQPSHLIKIVCLTTMEGEPVDDSYVKDFERQMFGREEGHPIVMTCGVTVIELDSSDAANIVYILPLSEAQQIEEFKEAIANAVEDPEAATIIVPYPVEIPERDV